MTDAQDIKAEFLGNKNVLLSSPGTLENENYYSTYSHSASYVETTWGVGKTQQSIPSLQFGSTSSINIPNGSFLSEVYLRCVLPSPNANVTYCRGWLYSAIAEIQWLIGASNSSVTTISGHALFAQAMAQCKEEEKRSEALRLAGEEWLSTPLAPLGQDVPVVEGSIIIPLPFSTMCDKKGIDTRMLTSNVVLTIKWNNSDHFCGGSGVYPSAFTNATIFYHQGDLSNTNDSLSVPMKLDPQLIYSYPFIHAMPLVTNGPFSGKRASQGQVTVNLTGFINSDLIGMAFYVVKTTDLLSTGGNSVSPFNCDNISNITIRYNGNILHAMPGQSYKLTNMNGTEASFFQNSVINQGTIAPFTSSPKDCYPVYINFSKSRDACYGGERFSNVFRVSNQTLTVSFSTQYGPEVQYEMLGCYFFNGIIGFKNGQSYIYYD